MPEILLLDVERRDATNLAALTKIHDSMRPKTELPLSSAMLPITSRSYIYLLPISQTNDVYNTMDNSLLKK